MGIPPAQFGGVDEGNAPWRTDPKTLNSIQTSIWIGAVITFQIPKPIFPPKRKSDRVSTRTYAGRGLGSNRIFSQDRRKPDALTHRLSDSYTNAAFFGKLELPSSVGPVKNKSEKVGFEPRHNTDFPAHALTHWATTRAHSPPCVLV